MAKSFHQALQKPGRSKGRTANLSATSIIEHRSGRLCAGEPVHYAFDAADFKKQGGLQALLDDLKNHGVHITVEQVGDIMRSSGYGMDSTDLTPLAPLTPANAGALIQFLQVWMPGAIRIMTKRRVADTLLGVTTAGDFADAQIVQTVIENLGHAVPYSDRGNIPLSSYNPTFETRDIIRFEKGFDTGYLENLQQAKQRIDNAAEKRLSVFESLEIARNRVALYGYNDGSNRTFGMFNDPNLPAYVNVAAGAAGTTWDVKTFLEITADIRSALASLRKQGRGNIDVRKTPIVLGVPTAKVDYLSTTNTLGSQSVMEWLNETYPNVRVEDAPDFEQLNGGADVFYLYAETLDDPSSDNGRVFDQIVVAREFAIGVEKRVKQTLEDYANAMAGTFLKRPLGVVRRSGI